MAFDSSFVGAPQPPSISSTTTACIGLFESLAELSSSWTATVHGISHEAVLDNFGQIRIWASNIGALQSQSLPSSLDHRLREAPKFAAEVISLLEDLVETLTDVHAILSGGRENRVGSLVLPEEESPDNDSASIIADNNHVPPMRSPDYDPDILSGLDRISEVEELFSSIPEVISMLFRTSVLIRNNSSRDRFSKAQAAISKAAVDPKYDIDYVKEKFPTLRCGEMEWLGDRLGKAIAQRRQFLWYCRDHRKKLDQPVMDSSRMERLRFDNAEKTDELPEISNHGQPEAVDDAKSQLSKQTGTVLAPTTASTVIPAKLDSADILRTLGDIDDDIEAQSVTSYATSVEETENSSALTVVPLEEVAKPGQNFECPYCWTIQKFRSHRSWKKHVMADLKAYICTAEECDMKLFTDSRTWFNHEMQNHLVEWKCCFCSRTSFSQLASFKSHLSQKHEIQLDDQQLTSLSHTCKRSKDSISPHSCCICDRWEMDIRLRNEQIPADAEIAVTPRDYRRHLSTHMEQLALFALPREVPEGYADDTVHVASNINSRSSQSQSISTKEDLSAVCMTDIYAVATKLDVTTLKSLMGDMIKENISENLLRSAAANQKYGKEVMEFLLSIEGSQACINSDLLHLAASNVSQGKDLVELLLKHRPEGELVNYLVFYGAEWNNKEGQELIELLFYERQKEGGTLEEMLIWGAHIACLSLIRHCLDAGAEVETKNDKGETPLFVAAAHGKEAAVELLLSEGAQVDVKASNGATPLSRAAFSGMAAIIHQLLAHGANVEAGEPLHHATKKGHEECVLILLGSGANVNALDIKKSATPLMLAIEIKNEAVTQKLIAAGALSSNVDHKDNDGRTALWHAAKAGIASIIQVLIELDADVNAEDHIGQTPLSAAVMWGNKAAVEKLIDARGSLKWRDKEGRTLSMLAAERGYKDLVKLLAVRGLQYSELDGAPFTFSNIALRDLNIDALDLIHKQDGEGWCAILNPQQPHKFKFDVIHTMADDVRAASVAFSNDSEYFATGGRQGVRVFEVATGYQTCYLKDPTMTSWSGGTSAWVFSLSFSPNSRFLAGGGTDGLLRVWNIEKGLLHKTFPDQKKCIRGVEFMNHGRAVMSCGDDGTVHIWDTESNNKVFTLKASESLSSVKLSPLVPHVFATGAEDGMWSIWNASTGKLSEKPESPLVSQIAGSQVAFSSDGKYLFATEDNVIKMWELGTSAAAAVEGVRKSPFVRAFQGHERPIRSIAVMPDDHCLLSACYRGTVLLWDIETSVAHAMIKIDEDDTSLATSPDGKYFATAGYNKVRIWSCIGCKRDE